MTLVLYILSVDIDNSEVRDLTRLTGYRFDDLTKHLVEFSSRTSHAQFGQIYFKEHHGVLQPFGSGKHSWQREPMTCWEPLSYYWIYRNAEFMRMTLVDESIPLKSEQKVFGIFDGCRISNALALGMIRYWPALPEIREAMLHDPDRDLCIQCIESIGLIGPRARSLAKDIRKVVIENHDSYFRATSVEALAELRDPESVPFLRELYEETRSLIHKKSESNLWNYDSWDLLLLRAITEALIKLDKEMARECLAIGLLDANPHVYHHTKSAFWFSRDYYQMKLMDSSWSVAIGFLPSDPGLNLAQRRRA